MTEKDLPEANTSQDPSVGGEMENSEQAEQDRISEFIKNPPYLCVPYGTFKSDHLPTNDELDGA